MKLKNDVNPRPIPLPSGCARFIGRLKAIYDRLSEGSNYVKWDDQEKELKDKRENNANNGGGSKEREQ